MLSISIWRSWVYCGTWLSVEGGGADELSGGDARGGAREGVGGRR